MNIKIINNVSLNQKIITNVSWKKMNGFFFNGF